METASTGIANLDLAVIVVYFIVVLGIGLWIASKTSTGDDLFLGGSHLRVGNYWPLVICLQHFYDYTDRAFWRSIFYWYC